MTKGLDMNATVVSQLEQEKQKSQKLNKTIVELQSAQKMAAEKDKIISQQAKKIETIVPLQLTNMTQGHAELQSKYDQVKESLDKKMAVLENVSKKSSTIRLSSFLPSTIRFTTGGLRTYSSPRRRRVSTAGRALQRQP